ncbi:hypothetical protein M758_10G027400 [Ceratodon purpureus]|nr:hypothetical protein M758_10G027400 [Ceratodon purpureus]
MLPTKDGKGYPWQISHSRLNFLSLAGNRIAKSKAQKKVTSSIVARHKQKTQKEMKFCQCNKVEAGEGIPLKSTKAARKAYVLPEFTHLECKNADGSSYLQILDSDTDSEMTTLD